MKNIKNYLMLFTKSITWLVTLTQSNHKQRAKDNLRQDPKPNPGPDTTPTPTPQPSPAPAPTAKSKNFN